MSSWRHCRRSSTARRSLPQQPQSYRRRRSPASRRGRRSRRRSSLDRTDRHRSSEVQIETRALRRPLIRIVQTRKVLERHRRVRKGQEHPQRDLILPMSYHANICLQHYRNRKRPNLIKSLSKHKYSVSMDSTNHEVVVDGHVSTGTLQMLPFYEQ